MARTAPRRTECCDCASSQGGSVEALETKTGTSSFTLIDFELLRKCEHHSRYSLSATIRMAQIAIIRRFGLPAYRRSRAQIRLRTSDQAHRKTTSCNNSDGDTDTIAIWRTQSSGEHFHGKGTCRHGRRTEAYQKSQYPASCMLPFFDVTTQ